MKKQIIFLLFSANIFAQAPIDSIPKKITQEDLFSDYDIVLIDSLLMESKYKSPLYETTTYILKDAENKEVASVELSTEILKERLQKIDAKTPFHLAYNPALEKVIKSYLKYRKKYYPALMAKAEYYFPMFEKYLDQYDIPLEMKYLAIVESALDPTAKSRVGATGLWQFMYTTGIQYKLKVSSYVDERQDPLKSTIAACQYLSDLFTVFGDWDLVLAAYNSGPGNVAKAIKRSGGYRNYWNIRPFLPTETAGYVPAFYATMYLFEYQKEHELIADAPQIRHFETDTIHVKKTITFDQVSETTGISSELIQLLNPSYKLDVIPFIEGKNYSITLPRKNTFQFLDKEQEIYALAEADASKREKPLPKYFEMDKRIRYKVKSGDFLGKIANKFGVRVSDLKRWNRLKTSRLKIGQRLSVYPKKLAIAKSSAKKTSTKVASNNNKKANFETYTVKKGDSLWIISRKYKNVSIDQIKKWNNIWSVKSLKPGTKLKIYKS
ncbi:LysM peptidoglycan-binding domain-containing protein [Polaribacter batillariae]|uniref:LysM peptidoglycan-binding domain-containing protein n=1 Tax=Polaribacter batillariae TaxID=2808900 RepID=A0ABX7SZ03_9FLAO|nr:LysM peptidoglycan-binding domain-containing protein [Polaribacter batillariae]QTD39117.1 LysM peptidoglycan-binding domain-containing protein [Polaribacter batillariae]